MAILGKCRRVHLLSWSKGESTGLGRRGTKGDFMADYIENSEALNIQEGVILITFEVFLFYIIQMFWISPLFLGICLRRNHNYWDAIICTEVIWKLFFIYGAERVRENHAFIPTDNIAVSATGQFLVSYINWGVGEPRVHKLIIMGMSSRIEIEQEGAVDSKR